MMREVRTEIDIAAPLTKVWDILMDFNYWNEWNPIITQASGTASSGASLSITMRGKDGKDGPKYMPSVTNVEEHKYFSWRAKMMAGFLFTNDKVFELEENGSGTKLVHRERYGGLLVPMFWSKLNQHVPSMLESMNDALKKMVEKGTGL